jgi:hypothetical protein
LEHAKFNVIIYLWNNDISFDKFLRDFDEDFKFDLLGELFLDSFDFFGDYFNLSSAYRSLDFYYSICIIFRYLY